MNEVFTRTTGGLQNYSAFFNTDVTVFVEGKKHATDNVRNLLPISVKTSDELFHQSVLGIFCSNKKFKIKSVGCKNDLAEYAAKIMSGSLQDCAVIFDSDYESVTSSWINMPRVMRTSGYSWENDMWVPEICERVVTLFAGGRDWDRDKFIEHLQLVSSRLSRLSQIEVCCRAHGKNFIVSNGKSVGVSLSSKDAFGIGKKEVERLISKLRSILGDILDKELLHSLIGRMRQMPASMLVRGHLWEAACITLIAGVVKTLGAAQTLASDNVRNVALGVFAQDPANYLAPEAINHYKAQLKIAGFC